MSKAQDFGDKRWTEMSLCGQVPMPRVLIVADRNSCLIVRNMQEVILFEFSKTFLFKQINIFYLH